MVNLTNLEEEPVTFHKTRSIPSIPNSLIMNQISKILLVCLVSGINSIGFAQKAEPAVKKEEELKTAGMRKVASGRGVDVIIDKAQLEADIEAAVDQALREVDTRLESLEIHIEPIHIELGNMNIALDPIVINIPELNIDIEPIGIELDELDFDEENDFEMEEDENDEDDREEQRKELEKVKEKSKTDKEKSDKEKEKSDKEKTKGLKKID